MATLLWLSGSQFGGCFLVWQLFGFEFRGCPGLSWRMSGLNARVLQEVQNLSIVNAVPCHRDFR